ncbi:hypothetical protein [Paenibacillus sp. GCM10027626]|uniref:hypothetical protein n=1 Tax=Paenibacillus sp. GCM10027626 TaxID=3273411 RepID=UPI00363FEDFB
MTRLPDSPFNSKEFVAGVLDHTKWFLTQNQLFVMLGAAVVIACVLLMVIVNLFDRNKEQDKDDDDYEYKRI